MHEYEPDEDLLSGSRKLQEFGDEGDMALDVVLEFLAFFQFEHALAVFKAEASVENRPAVAVQHTKLCERLGVNVNGASPPLLIQMLLQVLSSERSDRVVTTQRSAITDRWQEAREEEEPAAAVQQSRTSSAKVEETTDAVVRSSTEDALVEKVSRERHPTPLVLHTNDVTEERDRRTEKSRQEEEDERNGDRSEDEMDVSLAEDLASGSELNESIAEEQSTSMNYSQDYENASRDEQDFAAKASYRDAVHTGGKNQTAVIREGEEDEDDDEEEENPPGTRITKEEVSVAPPPAPTQVSPSSLPPTTSTPLDSSSKAKETHQEDDEFDEELEAARLSSLDARLKAMEAEDETGTLQQLKATLQMELQGDDGGSKRKSAASSGDDDHDAYGSDFEEEEVISEVSDDEVGSVSDFSEHDESGSAFGNSTSTRQPLPSSSSFPLQEDRAVGDENALNSYDYIEEVEKDW